MNTKFQALKKFDFNNSTAHLWVFKTSAADIRYRTLYVQTDSSLMGQLKEFVNIELERLTEQSPYSYISQNNENSCLSITQNETDFNFLKAQVDRVESEHRASGVKELKGSKGYVVKFTHNNITIYAVKRSTSTWKTAYQKKYINMIFSNGELAGIQDNSFTIEKSFDFYVIDDAIFIANKRGFETAMQHRSPYTQAFVQLQQNTTFNNLFSDIQPVVEYIGTNSIQLRRMAVVEEKGVYSQPNFMSILQAVNTQHGWGINFNEDSSQIIPCEQTIKTILQVLLDHRLMSQITENIYDVPDAIKI
jgi:hypothetical protein